MRSLIVGMLLLCVVRVSAQDNTVQNPFGVVEGFWFPEVTCDLGVGWERIIFDWSQHQPEKADDWYTLNVDDRWLKAADLCNREIVAVVKNTPQWATDGEAGAGVPKNLDLPIDNPDNYWANFIRKTVEYYASRGVYHYIIWNEPDIDKTAYGHEFSGELEDYFKLLKVAYLVAKQTNPNVMIHLAGTTYWHDVNAGREPYFERLIQRIVQDPDAQANGYYFDVVSLHLYFRTQTVYDIVNDVQAMLEKYALQKAIWINEMNAAPTNDPQWMVQRPQYPLDLAQQASFIIQATGLALVNGVERIAVYKLYDQQLPAGGESFGILSPANASPRPAFFAWQMMTRYFADTVHSRLAQTPTISVVHSEHQTGVQSFMAWAIADQATTVEIQATAEKAYLLDYMGNLSIVTPAEGVYKLSLPPARCNELDGCFIGGEPLILFQISGETEVREISSTMTMLLTFEESS